MSEKFLVDWSSGATNIFRVDAEPAHQCQIVTLAQEIQGEWKYGPYMTFSTQPELTYRFFDALNEALVFAVGHVKEQMNKAQAVVDAYFVELINLNLLADEVCPDW